MKTFVHLNEPYGCVEFSIETVEKVTATETSERYIKYRAEKGWLRLKGIVIKGGETSRLFQYSHTRDLKGQPYTLEVPPEAFEKGQYRTIAM